MKRHLLIGLVAAAIMPMASNATVVKSNRTGKHIMSAQSASTEQLTMTNAVAAYYFPENETANYYVILSNADDAQYDANQGIVTMTNGFAVILDLYAPASNPIVLPTGSYTLDESGKVYTCTSEYSLINKYDTDGDIVGYSGYLTSDVTVDVDGNGIYTIAATMVYDETTYEISYNGRLPFEDSSDTPTVFPQIKHDMDITATGALGIYNGDLFDNNTGMMYVNLFDCAFEDETGIMLEDGYCVSLLLVGKKFSDPKSATVEAGTYECARNLKRGTFYPGMEIDYMGLTIPFGTYAKQRDGALYGADDYGYGYMTEGTIVVEQTEGAAFHIAFEGKTNLGYILKGTFEGEIPVIDNSDDDGGGAHISTLEDDVELALEQIPVARVYNNGDAHGYQQFIVDIGSPSGKDDIYEGDIMRLEFICENGSRYLTEGTYTVMDYDHSYTNMYAPGKLIQGYFVEGGDLSGTRYMHFEEGRYLIMDNLAPAVSGTVGVTKVDDTNWRFDIDVMDDLNYRISGSWTGPIELQYNPDLIDGGAGVDTAISDSGEMNVEYIGESVIRIVNADASAVADVYSAMGVKVYSRPATEDIDLSGCIPGVYVLNVNNETVKILKK